MKVIMEFFCYATIFFTIVFMMFSILTSIIKKYFSKLELKLHILKSKLYNLKSKLHNFVSNFNIFIVVCNFLLSLIVFILSFLDFYQIDEILKLFIDLIILLTTIVITASTVKNYKFHIRYYRFVYYSLIFINYLALCNNLYILRYSQVIINNVLYICIVLYCLIYFIINKLTFKKKYTDNILSLLTFDILILLVLIYISQNEYIMDVDNQLSASVIVVIVLIFIVIRSASLVVISLKEHLSDLIFHPSLSFENLNDNDILFISEYGDDKNEETTEYLFIRLYENYYFKKHNDNNIKVMSIPKVLFENNEILTVTFYKCSEKSDGVNKKFSNRYEAKLKLEYNQTQNITIVDVRRFITLNIIFKNNHRFKIKKISEIDLIQIIKGLIVESQSYKLNKLKQNSIDKIDIGFGKGKTSFVNSIIQPRINQYAEVINISAFELRNDTNIYDNILGTLSLKKNRKVSLNVIFIAIFLNSLFFIEFIIETLTNVFYPSFEKFNYFLVDKNIVIIDFMDFQLKHLFTLILIFLYLTFVGIICLLNKEIILRYTFRDNIVNEFAYKEKLTKKIKDKNYIILIEDIDRIIDVSKFEYILVELHKLHNYLRLYSNKVNLNIIITYNKENFSYIKNQMYTQNISHYSKKFNYVKANTTKFVDILNEDLVKVVDSEIPYDYDQTKTDFIAFVLNLVKYNNSLNGTQKKLVSRYLNEDKKSDDNLRRIKRGVINRIIKYGN